MSRQEMVLALRKTCDMEVRQLQMTKQNEI
jgi:hypothetical protein